jgi:hypothetical protein
MIIGHSLGSVIIHDLMSQMIKYRFFGFDTLAERTSVFTMGSPLSLFSLVGEQSPTETFKSWVNFWHPRDPVAFKMAPLGDGIHDVKLTTFSWLPGKLHSQYWTSPKVHQAIASEIIDHHKKDLGAPLSINVSPIPAEILERDHGPALRAGLSEYYYDFGELPFPTLISTASQIDVCNIYGGNWLQRNAQYFTEVLKRTTSDVRVCIVHEESHSISGLAYQFRGKTEDDIRINCQIAIGVLKEVWEKAKVGTENPGRLRIYGCRNPVSHSFYRFDDVVYYAPRSIASSKFASTPIPSAQLRRNVLAHKEGELTFGDWLIRDFEELIKESHDHEILFDSLEQ